MNSPGEKFSASRYASAACSWVMRNVPLKHRHFVTRTGRLRARYMIVPALSVLTLMISAVQSLPVITGNPATAMTASYDAAPNEAETARSLRQQRLERYASVPAKPVAPPPAAEPQEKTIVVSKGDTLAGVLQKTGLDETATYRAMQALVELVDPRTIRPGQKISVRFDPNEDGSDYSLSELTMDVNALKTVRLDPTIDGGFNAKIDEKETLRRTYASKGDIELSLYDSALKAGLPPSVVANLIRIYSWDVDFQRDVREGDSFEALYDQVETADGTLVEGGDIVFARMNVNGRDIALYRYENENGSVDYYTSDGISIRKALLSTPVDGARLSSGFGMRRHPILGYSKMHKGTDFAAPAGTPIYAAGDGTIEQLGRNGSYGNYVRIRHNSSTKTAYAHMKGFAKGIGNGSHVKQGQVIGYIGTTGRSTGPHLHYEVLVNGTQVNPRGVQMQQGDTLKGRQLAAFKAHMERIDRQYNLLSGSMKMASAETQTRSAGFR